MKSKIVLVLMIMLLATPVILIADGESADADTMNAAFSNTEGGTVTITSNVDATIVLGPNDSYYGSVTVGSTITITASASAGYKFYYADYVGTRYYATDLPIQIGPLNYPQLTIMWMPDNKYNLEFVRSDSSYGSLSQYRINYLDNNESVTIGSNTFTVDGITVTATAYGAAVFDGWYDDNGNQISTGYTINRDQTITARFSMNYTLDQFQVVNNTGGSVTVTSTMDQSVTVPSGTVYNGFMTVGATVTLTGTASQYHAFQSFVVNGTTYTTSIKSFTFSGATTVTANWQLTTSCHITVASTTGGSVDYSNLYVPPGSTIILYGDEFEVYTYHVTATATSGYYFADWSVLSGSTVTADMTVTASFVPNSMTRITISNSQGGTVTVSSSVDASVTIASGEVFSGFFTTGATLTLSATAQSGYSFSEFTWVGGSEPIASNPYSFTFSGGFINVWWDVLVNYTVTVVPDDGGTVSRLSFPVNPGSVVRINNNVMTVDGTSVTASADSGYFFVGWSVADGTVINGDTTIRALFAVTTGDLFWSNDLYNGSVTIAYRFTGGNNNMQHSMSMDLYNGTVNDMVTTWTQSAYSLNVQLSYPLTTVYVSLLKNGTAMTSYTVDTEIGQWPGFELTINANDGCVSFTPMNKWTDFTSYSTYADRERIILDWSAETKGQSVYVIEHEDTGTGAHASFQVVSTMPFLNTYGVVMTDPSINVYSYFPEYESVRLNFNSFALLGNTMTVNGKTMSVSDGKVTVYYITSNKVNTWVNIGTPDAMSKTLTLSNINITWQEGTCTLTFVNDKFSVEMGSYSAGSETVSFTGFWYFTADLYEPVTATETSISGDWDYLPDIGGPAMLLIYLGCLFGFAVLAQAEKGLKWMDAAILIIAGLIGFILLG